MANVRALERRIEQLEQQVAGHHRHGTLANRLARLEDTVEGDPMQHSSIAQRLDEIEARTRGESIPERVDEILDDETTAGGVAERVETIETKLDLLEERVEAIGETAGVERLCDRVEARLLALEHALNEDS